MKATIYMKFDGNQNRYPYGTYPFDTDIEKDFVNGVASRVKRERGCEIDIDAHELARKPIVDC